MNEKIYVNYGSGDPELMVDLLTTIYKSDKAFRETGEDQKIVELGNKETVEPGPEPETFLVTIYNNSVVDSDLVTCNGVNVPTNNGLTVNAQSESTLHLTATPSKTSEFVNWIDNDTKQILSEDLSFDYIVTKESTISANFRNLQCDITVFPDCFDKNDSVEVNGTAITGTTTTTVDYGELISLIAVPSENSNFAGWFIDNTQISSDLSLSYQVSDSVIITAKFEKKD